MKLVYLTCTSAAVLTRQFNQQDADASVASLQKIEPRLSLADSAEWTEYRVQEPEGPGTYSFGYDVEDPETGNVQFRTEERSANGTVTGSYGYVAPDGSVLLVHYVADALGYRTKIEQARASISPLRNKLFKSNTALNENTSPEMLAAIQSLQSKNRFPKEEQHIRPKDQTYSNSIGTNKEDITNNQEHRNIDYNVYFVP